MDPSNYVGSREVHERHTAVELCQYVSCIARIHFSVQRSFGREDPLYNLLKSVCKNPTKCIKCAINEYNLYD